MEGQSSWFCTGQDPGVPSVRPVSANGVGLNCKSRKGDLGGSLGNAMILGLPYAPSSPQEAGRIPRPLPPKSLAFGSHRGAAYRHGAVMLPEAR